MSYRHTIYHPFFLRNTITGMSSGQTTTMAKDNIPGFCRISLSDYLITSYSAITEQRDFQLSVHQKPFDVRNAQCGPARELIALPRLPSCIWGTYGHGRDARGRQGNRGRREKKSKERKEERRKGEEDRGRKGTWFPAGTTFSHFQFQPWPQGRR